MKNNITFEKYTIMKKRPDIIPVINDRKEKIIIDTAFLSDIPACESDLILSELTSVLSRDSIEKTAFLHPIQNPENGYHVYINVYCDITHVYDRKTGKRLYTYKQVTGYTRIAYKPNIYGVVPDGSLPIETNKQGSTDHNYSRDVEI